MLTTDGAVFVFSSFNFFAEFLGFEKNMISTHHRVTFHALVVSFVGTQRNITETKKTLWLPKIPIGTLSNSKEIFKKRYRTLSNCNGLKYS